MSNQSNDLGRAYEFACLTQLRKEIAKVRPVQILENSSFFAAKRAWENYDSGTHGLLESSAAAATLTLFEMEPMILDTGEDILELYIQPDVQGEIGDVRDIIISRKNALWEIGLSIKHNHFAVKHSRLAQHLDFGERWFGRPCSQQYWKSVSPIFEYLVSEKAKGRTWRELPAKEDDVYIPLLHAFVEEVMSAYAMDTALPRKMVEYLLGEFDFYKIISIDSKNLTRIQSYNLHGTLNKPSKKAKPTILIPIAALPTRIVSLDFKPGSNNTVELYMDGGWQFSFRIHNASTKVEPSLKFDIQIVGMPATILVIDCKWH